MKTFFSYLICHNLSLGHFRFAHAIGATLNLPTQNHKYMQTHTNKGSIGMHLNFQNCDEKI